MRRTISWSCRALTDFKVKAVVDILQQKLAKRKSSSEELYYGPIQPAAGSTARQEITISRAYPSRSAKRS